MAFWMDIPTLEMDDLQLRPFTGATATPNPYQPSRNNTTETRARSSQSRTETTRSVLKSGASSVATAKRTSTITTSRPVSKDKLIKSRESTATISRAGTANALDFLERPPSVVVSAVNLPLLKSVS